MQAKPSGERRAGIRVVLGRSVAVRKGYTTALLALLLLGLVSSRSLFSSSSDSQNGNVAVSIQEEILLTQSGTNANLKIRLGSGVTAQVWGDTSNSCSSPTGSLNETTSGTYSIPLNTIPFGANQNDYVCVRSSDSTLNANVVWPHTPASLAFLQQPSNTAVGSSITPAVTVAVLDSTGTLISSSTASITVAIGSNPSSGTLSGIRTRNAVNGIASFDNLGIDKSGAGYTLTAASMGLTGVTSNTFNITAGTASRLAFGQQPSTTTAGNAISPVVTVLVQDANGNTVTSDSSNVTITINGGGVFSGTSTTTVTASSGVATFSNLAPTKSGSFTISAADGSLTGATSDSFAVNNAAGSKLVFTTQPGGGTGGAAWNSQPQVTVQDQFNNTVTTGAGSTASITLAITPGTGTAGAALTCTANPLTAPSGLASFSGCQIDKVGSNYALTASGSGLANTTSSTFNITPGAAAKLAFTTQPGGGIATAAWTAQPVVTVQDAGGNTVTGSAAQITLSIATNPSGGSLTCATNPLNASSGVATFSNCKIDKGGNSTFTLNATSGALASATSSAFTISDFGVAANPSSRAVTSNNGNQVTSTISLSNLGGFGGNVSLTCSDSVTGSKSFICGSTGNGTISFSPASISGATTSTMTATAANNTDDVVHTITLTGTYTGVSPSLVRTTTVTITVSP